METEFLPELYDADTQEFIEQIQLRGGNTRELLVVGHNPATEQAAALFCRPGPGPVAFPGAFPTAALAVIDLDADDWVGVKPRSGSLVAFTRPRDLAAEND